MPLLVAAAALLAVIGGVAVAVALLDTWQMWCTRRRPVRDANGRWRAPRRPGNGRGRR